MIVMEDQKAVVGEGEDRNELGMCGQGKENHGWDKIVKFR